MTMNPESFYYFQLKRFANSVRDEGLHYKEIDGKPFLGWFRKGEESQDTILMLKNHIIPGFVARFVNETLSLGIHRLVYVEIPPGAKDGNDYLFYPITEPLKINSQKEL